jgi:IS1 family transposase
MECLRETADLVLSTVLAAPNLLLSLSTRVHESNCKLRGHWLEKTSDSACSNESLYLKDVSLMELGNMIL